MHLPDNFVSMEINAVTAAVSAGVVGFALWRGSKTLTEKQVPLLGSTAAFIFAAQMLNFPIAGGTSGHFLGATMASVLLGPWNACLAMAVVLIIQCLAFGDGGLTALGSNIFNMGVVGAIGGYLVLRALMAVLPHKPAAFIGATFATSWLAVVAGSAACALELAFSGTSPLGVALPAMTGVHALIGIGEGLITCAMVSMLLAVRPDLVQMWQITRPELQLKKAMA